MPNIPIPMAISVVLAILLGLAGWEIKHEIQRNSRLSTELSTAKESLKMAKEAQAIVSQIDQSFEAKRNEIHANQIKLDTDVAARAVVLRVPAKCVPNAATATGQPDDQRPELDPSARPDYRSLRTGIMEREAKIEGLQDYIAKICLRL